MKERAIKTFQVSLQLIRHGVVVSSENDSFSYPRCGCSVQGHTAVPLDTANPFKRGKRGE